MMFSVLSNLCPFRTHKHTHTVYSYFSPKLSVSFPIFSSSEFRHFFHFDSVHFPGNHCRNVAVQEVFLLLDVV